MKELGTGRELDEATCYAALSRRDAAFEGAFFVGVRTTGVFCRPTCPAPKPQRKNCEYFPGAEQALLASHRPCKRCRPLSPPDEPSGVVRLLVDAVELDPFKRWREADFERLSIHASTARRQFKNRFGMTFVEYARARRLGEAFRSIRSGSTLINAQLDAGYESSSGFRDAFARIMGAPPSSGTARMLSAAWFDTPVGSLVAIGDHNALHLLDYVDRRGLEGQIRRLRTRLRAGIAPGPTPPIAQVRAELVEYFDGRRSRFETPLDRHGTAFQNAVWDELVEIAPGQTRSYSEVARVVGRPQAVRAVARANGANQYAIIIPCHRVIGADGGLVGYGGGLWRKKWLLEHERRYWKTGNATAR